MIIKFQSVLNKSVLAQQGKTIQRTLFGVLIVELEKWGFLYHCRSKRFENEFESRIELISNFHNYYLI